MLINNNLSIHPINKLLNPFEEAEFNFLLYPFPASGNLKMVLCGSETANLKVMVAKSAIEVFQNISAIENPNSFEGMMLCFKNELIPSYALFTCSFDFQSVWIIEDASKTLLVEKVAYHPFNQNFSGPNVQIICGYRYVLLLPSNNKKFDIDCLRNASFNTDSSNNNFRFDYK